MSYSVGMSVDPCIDAWPRSAMIPPPGRVAARAGPVGARRRGERLGDFQERVARHAAGAFDHLRRVAREMAPQDLENASRMLERRIALVAAEIRRLPAAIFSV